MHIAVRHGFTPANQMLKLSEQVAGEKDLNEALIVFAWLQIQPDDVLTEIEKACIRMQIAKETFTYKILAPMYPLNQEKYTNIDYYKKSQISLAIERKTEQKINKSM